MDSKELNAIFEQMIENETKFKEQKNLVIELRTQIERRDKRLTELKDELKGLEQEFEYKSKLIPNSDSELILIVTENDIFCQQINAFEAKAVESRHKIYELNVNRKHKIDAFVDHSFNFTEQFGPNGSVRKQTIDCRKRVKNLRAIRDELQTKVEKLKINSKDFELVLNEKNSLNDEICVLETNRNKAKNENFELKCIGKRLENTLKALKERPNFDQEFVDLRKQLQSIEVIERSYQVKCRFLKSSELYSNPNLSSDGKEEKHPMVVDLTVETMDTKQQNRFESNGKYLSESKSELKPNSGEEQVKEVFEQNIWDLKRKRRQHLTKNSKE